MCTKWIICLRSHLRTSPLSIAAVPSLVSLLRALARLLLGLAARRGGVLRGLLGVGRRGASGAGSGAGAATLAALTGRVGLRGRPERLIT